MEIIMLYFPKFLMVVGALRLINKPLFSILKMYAKATPDDSDDKAIEAVEKSKTYSMLTYILDYLGSIKVGPK